MNVLDWFLLAILGAFVFRGYRKGLVHQILHVGGLLSAFLLAGRMHDTVASWSVFENVRRTNPQAALVIAFLGVFFASAAAAAVLARSLALRLTPEFLRPGDKVLGASLGLAIGVLLLGGVALGLKQWALPEGAVVPADIQERSDGLLEESALVPRLADGCLALVALIPRSGREELRRFYVEHGGFLAGGREAAGEPSAPRARFERGGIPELSRGGPRLSRDPAREEVPPPLPDLGTWYKLYRELGRPGARPKAVPAVDKTGGEPVPATGTAGGVPEPKTAPGTGAGP